MICNGYQVCGVIQSGREKDGTAGGLLCVSRVWDYTKLYHGQRRTCRWFVMGNRYVFLCQLVQVATKDLVVVCNGYQGCRVIQRSSRSKKDLLVMYNKYQVYGVIPSSSSSKERPAGGL